MSCCTSSGCVIRWIWCFVCGMFGVASIVVCITCGMAFCFILCECDVCVIIVRVCTCIYFIGVYLLCFSDEVKTSPQFFSLGVTHVYGGISGQ